jgi:hypothetical protein
MSTEGRPKVSRRLETMWCMGEGVAAAQGREVMVQWEAKPVSQVSSWAASSGQLVTKLFCTKSLGSGGETGEAEATEAGGSATHPWPASQGSLATGRCPLPLTPRPLTWDNLSLKYNRRQVGLQLRARNVAA